MKFGCREVPQEELCEHCGCHTRLGDELLLCDGCEQGAAHLQCAGLPSVPDGEWFCKSCCGVLRARKQPVFLRFLHSPMRQRMGSHQSCLRRRVFFCVCC